MPEDLVKTFNDTLVHSIKETDELLLPLLREYLNNVSDIRMAMSSEVKNIIQSARQLSEITKHNEDLLEFAKTIMILRDMLTPELMEKIKRLTDDKP